MPTIRYQIRNEYALGDPELYRAAGRDDPEALLQGVAMSGLVGLLRQLSDLAGFAAEVFHDLHDEVMTTAAKGHKLMLRAQQLEAEFPSIEIAFLSRTSHSDLAYNMGTDWHANLQLDHNLVTRGDKPRFVMDSYEECRGPPQLSLLEKFDVSGAGACLKRYSEPSFFKKNFASFRMAEEQSRREKRSRKTKKGSLWRNGETSESLLAPFISSRMQRASSDQISDEFSARRVKLKARHCSISDKGKAKSYLEHLLEINSLQLDALPEISMSHSYEKLKSSDISQSANEVHEIVPDVSANKKRSQSPPPTKQYDTGLPTDELKEQGVMVKDLPEIPAEPAAEITEICSTFSTIEQKELLVEDENQSEENIDECWLADTECSTEGSASGYISDGIASESDNYVDARTTMDSDAYEEHKDLQAQSVDSDAYEEHKDLQAQSVDSDAYEEHKDLHAQSVDSDAYKEHKDMQSQSPEHEDFGKSTSLVGSNNLSNKDVPANFADSELLQRNTISSDMLVTSDICSSKTTQDKTSGNWRYGDVMELKSSKHLLSGRTQDAAASDILISESEFGEVSSTSCITTTTSDNSSFYHHGSPRGTQLVAAELYEISSCSAKASHLDDELPRRTEAYIHPPEEKDDVVQKEFAKISDVSCDYLDNTQDQVLVMQDNVPEKTNSEEYVEEPVIEVTTEISNVLDCCSQTKDGSVIGEYTTGYAEGSPPSLDIYVKNSLETVKPDAEACFVRQPDGSTAEVGNVVAPDDDSTSLGSVSNHENTDDLREKKIPVSTIPSPDVKSLSYSEETIECDNGVSTEFLPLNLGNETLGDDAPVLSNEPEVKEGPESNRDHAAVPDTDNYDPSSICSPDASVSSFPLPGDNALLKNFEDKSSLPPLPPAEWETGNFQLGSLPFAEEMDQPRSEAYESTPAPGTQKKLWHELETTLGEIAQPENMVSPTPQTADDMPQDNFSTSDEERVQPLKLSEQLVDGSHRHGVLELDREFVHPQNPSRAETEPEDDKNLYKIETARGHETKPSNSFSALENEDWQPSQLSGLTQNLEDKSSQESPIDHSLPDIEVERSESVAPTLYSKMVQSPDPLGAAPAAEEEKVQHGHGSPGGQDAQLQKVPRYASVSIQEENLSLLDDVPTSTLEDEEVKAKVSSLLNRPRDPLIEEVASHDRRMLRKVSEVELASTRPKPDEKETLLEQIKNRSYSLKPAGLTKPNFRGPSTNMTNLRVVAMLEKANAMRQAVTGGDDDDEDSWSDS